MSLFSFVELTYRMTLLKMRTYNGRVGYHNQDRSNTIRIRPLKESRYFPAVVIGADDLFTEKATQYWGDYYGVLTKTFGFCKGHQLAVIFIRAINRLSRKALLVVFVILPLFAVS